MSAPGGEVGAGEGVRSHDLRDGTEQAERPQAALAPGYVRVDERGLGDLLRLLTGVASNLTYFDRDDRPRGSWADLYRNSEACVTVEIAGADVAGMRAAFGRLGGRGLARSRALEVRRLAVRVDRWLGVLRRSGHPAGRRLAATIAAVVEEELAPSLHAAGTFLALDPAFESDGAAYGRFDAAWGLVPDGEGGVRFPRSTLPAGAAPRREHLASAYGALLAGISHLSAPAREALEELLRSGRNDPALGLVLAFLHLFRTSRHELNDFARRRLDFYYRRVLGIEPRGRAPDRAHLVLDPVAGVSSLRIPADTEFSAGKDDDDRELIFASDDPVVVSDARVGALRSLTFERDPLISPERELGLVTRILGGVASDPGPGTAEDEPTRAFPVSGPGSPVSGDGISVGFAVASPVLALAEGTRHVRFDVALGDPIGGEGTRLDDAIAELEDVGAGATGAFFRRFGRIFGRGLLGLTPPDGSGTRAAWCTADQARAIRAAAERVLGDAARGSLEVIDDLLDRDPLVLFHELFGQAVRVRYTGEAGWEEVEDVYVGPAPREVGRAGLRVEVKLGPDAAPVVGFSSEVHGTRHRGSLPVFGFRVNPGAIFNPYSLLEGLALEGVEVEVEVRGVTDLVAQNALGRLDAARPFQPFGPLPSRDSYLVVGSWEAARKDLVRASLDVEWGELPDAPGGFRQHYFLYGTGVSAASFRAEVSVLRDGRWEPEDPSLRSVVRLFETEDDGGRLADRVTLPLEPLEFFKPVDPGTDAEEFASMARARQGHFRLSLSPSEATFGHREHARLLTEVLSRNARRKKPEPLPNPPYTPVIRSMTMSYVARARVRPGAGSSDAKGRTGRILHEHPFGVEDVTEAGDGQVFTLMPTRPAVTGPGGVPEPRDGYLFIGLTGPHRSGPLSLLFHLHHAEVPDASASGSGVAWFHLASNRWRALDPSRVLGDTTDGFQRSGIVTLDLPDHEDPGSTILPPGLHWLAVGADRHMLSLAQRLLSVSTGAVRVTWQDRGNRRPDIAGGLPAGTIDEAASGIPGLGAVLQVGESFGGHPPEDPERLIVRTAERLRHKRRATAAWDYERLVLERFPGVAQVKVFPCTDTRYDEPVPGRVLVVVVPDLVRRDDDRSFTPRFSGGELIRIRDWLRGLSSDFAAIHVRNPVYEQVQIRCAVKLAPGSRHGYALRELNDALVDYISPWRPGGYGARFGWRIRRKEIEARIRSLAAVDFVTDFSMLQITLDSHGRHLLDDTARLLERDPAPEELAALPATSRHELAARFPWSLAVPVRRHYLQTTPDALEIPAEVTGVGELEIGTNFILDAGSEHG